jgi:hypothetical protein
MRTGRFVRLDPCVSPAGGRGVLSADRTATSFRLADKAMWNCQDEGFFRCLIRQRK